MRRVGADATIELDTNSYSVPWRLIGETVAVVVPAGGSASAMPADEVAAHAEIAGRRQRVIDAAHWQASPGRPARCRRHGRRAVAGARRALLRPLAEYERRFGGGW